VFYFYGRKKQIVKYYPPSLFNTIIEPFAGSAAYSLRDDNWRKDVILVERDERVATIWRWLISEATAKEIVALPELKIGQRSSDFFHIIHAATKQAFCYKTIKVTPVLAINWHYSKKYMAANIHKVKHWKIICGDYAEAPDMEATWFMDPPYQHESGKGYKYGSSSIDYRKLAEWALGRKGQVIFCERDDADYLLFRPLVTLTGVAGKRNRELIYHSCDAPIGSAPFSLPGLEKMSN